MATVKKHEHVAHIKKKKTMMYIMMVLTSSVLHGQFQTAHKTTNAKNSSATYGLGIQKYTYPYIS